MFRARTAARNFNSLSNKLLLYRTRNELEPNQVSRPSLIDRVPIHDLEGGLSPEQNELDIWDQDESRGYQPQTARALSSPRASEIWERRIRMIVVYIYDMISPLLMPHSRIGVSSFDESW